jgi:hypothetical protein
MRSHFANGMTRTRDARSVALSPGQSQVVRLDDVNLVRVNIIRELIPQSSF